MKAELATVEAVPVLSRAPYACPFIRVGDIVTVRDRVGDDEPFNAVVVALIYNELNKACCKTFPKLMECFCSDNKSHHPCSLGADCDLCPHEIPPVFIKPPQWAEEYWRQLSDSLK